MSAELERQRAAAEQLNIPSAGVSTCPVCHRTWLVTLYADCMLPACGCFGDEVGADNPARPCEPCGLRHAYTCDQMPMRVITTPLAEDDE